MSNPLNFSRLPTDKPAVRCAFTVLLSILASCASTSSSLPPGFTGQNFMKVRQGMTADEILTMFGEPKKVSQAVCGANLGQKWTCTTWEYGEFPYDHASFTFSGEANEVLILNNFKIDRK